MKTKTQLCLDNGWSVSSVINQVLSLLYCLFFNLQKVHLFIVYKDYKFLNSQFHVSIINIVLLHVQYPAGLWSSWSRGQFTKPSKLYIYIYDPLPVQLRTSEKFLFNFFYKECSTLFNAV